MPHLLLNAGFNRRFKDDLVFPVAMRKRHRGLLAAPLREDFDVASIRTQAATHRRRGELLGGEEGRELTAGGRRRHVRATRCQVESLIAMGMPCLIPVQTFVTVAVQNDLCSVSAVFKHCPFQGVVIAKLKNAPPATAVAVTPVRALTGTGVGLSFVVPSPSWPRSLWPHDQTVPSESSARLWKRPAATSMTSTLAGTGTGTATATNESLKVPSPSWPLAL